MAKANRSKTTKKENSSLPVTDRTVFWSDLQYIPPELKNETWAAQNLYFFKKNAVRFLDPKRANTYRAADRLVINPDIYRQLVDPLTPMGQGGEAKYFTANWKANPINLHLQNILKARLQQLNKQLEVNLTDKYAKTRQMEDNYRIIYQEQFREVINHIAPMVGLPKLLPSQDPFKWAQSFFDKQNSKDGGSKMEDSDVIGNFVDLIKNQITDNQDLALYNELIYKGDYEIVFEEGLKHYILNLNKWIDRWSDDFIGDIKNFNLASGEWYTDEIMGRPVIERIIPEELFVSPFKKKDGEDLEYYFHEWYVTFADFVKMMGRNLSEEQLKKVFEYQKQQGTSASYQWVPMSEVSWSRDNSMIRVGKAAVLTQNYDVFMEDVALQYPNYSTKDLSWRPDKEVSREQIRDEKHYNVWYSWFYIPPTTNNPTNADYSWQAQFIFDLKKNQDQLRFGEDGRYSKSPLVIYDNSVNASWMDIVEFWMPLIHHASHKFQNSLITDIDALAISDSFIGSLLMAIDEENKIDPRNPDSGSGGNGQDALYEQWKMIKQGNTGFLRMTDKNGNMLEEPGKYFVPIKNGQLERAEKWITMIALMYNEMVKSLAMPPSSAGEAIKPRTPVAALEASNESSDEASFFVEQSYEAFLKMYGERMVRYMLDIAQEPETYGYHDRWEDFVSVIGRANSMMLQGIKDIPAENIGINVNYVDTASKKQFVMDLATQYLKAGLLDEEFIDLIMGVDNWKYAFALMRMNIKKKKKEKKEEDAIQQQYIMQQKQMDLQIAQTLQGQAAQEKQAEIVTKGKVQDMINNSLNQAKYQTQAALKQQNQDQRLQENAQKGEIEKNKETHSKMLESLLPE